MTQITVVCVGKLKESYWRDAIAEYTKRLSAYCKVQIAELAEERLPQDPNDAQIAAVLEAEADRMLPLLEGKQVYALCIEAKPQSSEQFAAALSQQVDAGHKLAFVIGSSHGLSPRIKQLAQHKLSFSPMTFPHQLARVMLFEQLYRGFSIMHKGKYHK